MATSYNGAYDQLSAALAETFRPVVDDNVFGSNVVFQKNWADAEEVLPGRYFSVPILTGKNQTAVAFGQYDELSPSPQSLLSVATFPWPFYAVAITLSYQTVKVAKGVNERVDLISTQLEAAIASLADNCGTDVCNLTKSPSTPNGINALGIQEATDDGINVNNYGNILRTGGGSFANWQGQCNRKLTNGGIGSASNDAPISLFYSVYSRCTQGAQVPTDVYTSKDGVAAWMYALQAQQRLSPGDIANAGFAGAAIFGAAMYGDDHITNPVNGANVGANFYFLNRNKTKFYYMDHKGVEFLDWMFAPSGAIAKTSFYILCFQYVSSQPRTGGQLVNVNTVGNL